MLKTIVLILMFQDGYLGGHTTAAYFHTRSECMKSGEKIALQYTGYGHPTTFLCAATPTKAQQNAAKAYMSPRQEYKMPTSVTP